MFPEPGLNRPRTVGYPNYVHEILRHAGVCYTTIALNELPQRLNEIRLLITVGEFALSEQHKAQLHHWLSSGGGWISLGGICGMEQELGATLAAPFQGWAGGLAALGEGYLVPRMKDHPALAQLEKPLHFFSGTQINARGSTVLATMLDAHGRETDRAVIVEHAAQKGRAILIAADLTGTIVRIQQGIAVTRDGVSAPDGNAPVHDGVLKSGDGGVLDWIFDRDPVEGVPGLTAFLRPAADQWREVLLRSLFHLAQQLEVPLPLLWLYPRNLEAIAHMSHDTDGNEPPAGRKLLELLRTAEITTTWCVILPGYDQSLMQAIKDAGHEYATHYDAMTEGLEWSEQQFDRQLRELTAMFGESPVTNKNHYLRWEGDCELWEWCLKRGIQLDQSKGSSKAGEAGFNFGTCHPYKPVRFDGSEIDVLELATPTQDLNVFADEKLFPPLMEAVIKHHGVLHLLFHPAHMLKEYAAGALLRSAALAKQRGLEWWTGKQINAWERARRKLRWSNYQASTGAPAVTISCDHALPDATILWLVSPRLAEPRSARVTRWGFDFIATTRSIPANTECRVEV